MADNSYNPTAANILASLKIRGASVEGGSEAKAGYVPVLGADGKLDSSTIPLDSIAGLISIPPLPDVAFVDPNSDIANPTGSSSAPFKTVKAAAEAHYHNYILTGGYFGTESVTIPNEQTDLKVRFFSIGTSVFDSLTLNGYCNGSIFEFFNVSATNILFGSNVESCTAIMFGKGYFTTIDADDSDNVESVKVLSDSTVSINLENITNDAIKVYYLAAGDRISRHHVDDTGTVVETVEDALDTIDARKIRIPKFSSNASGLHADSYHDIPVSVDINAYSLVVLGTELAAAVNGVFHKNGDSPTYVNVTATKVTSTTSVAGTAVSQEVKFGTEADVKATVKVDEDNFLTIA